MVTKEKCAEWVAIRVKNKLRMKDICEQMGCHSATLRKIVRVGFDSPVWEAKYEHAVEVILQKRRKKKMKEEVSYSCADLTIGELIDSLKEILAIIDMPYSDKVPAPIQRARDVLAKLER